MCSSDLGALSECLAEAIRRVTGRNPELSTTGGTSDARFVQAHCAVAEFGLVGATMHKVDERVDLSDLAALTGRFDARFVACRRATARWTGSSFLAR